MRESRAPSIDDAIRRREPVVAHRSFDRSPGTEGARDIRSAVSRMFRGAERPGA